VSCDASGGDGGAGGGCGDGGGDGSGGSDASLVSQLWTRALGGLCLSTLWPTNASPSSQTSSSSTADDDKARDVEPKSLEAEAADAASECYVDLSGVQRWLGDNAGPWLTRVGLALFYILRLLALTTVMLVAAVRVRGVITERRRTDGASSTSTSATAAAAPSPTTKVPNSVVGNSGALTAAAATGKGKKEKGSGGGKGGNGGNGVVGRPCATCRGARGALLLPCGHTSLCFACATDVAAAKGLCPTCSSRVLTVHKAHLE